MVTAVVSVAEIARCVRECPNQASLRRRIVACRQRAWPSSQMSLQVQLIDDSSNITYENWLPSFNAKLDFGNGMLVRAAASKGIYRPDLSAFATGGTIGDNTAI